MQIPTYNAPPVAKFFLLTRCLQIFIAILLIGIIANFISTTTSSTTSSSSASSLSSSPASTSAGASTGASAAAAVSTSPPTETILILTSASLSALYILISLPFFLAGAQLGLLIMCLLDFAWVVAYSVAAVLLGRHVSHVSCIGIKFTTLAEAQAVGIGGFGSGGSGGLGGGEGLEGWVQASRVNCWVGKGAWGLCVAGAVLFAASGLVAPALFAKVRRARKS